MSGTTSAARCCAGHRILKLDLGNPAPWGLATPEPIVADVVQNIMAAQGYSDARGKLPEERAGT
ncbi:hypothetical protein AB0F59_24915 [Micromonospora lupini]|uniref:hypothetical protein n=1 Tax=Micromonospora lupini TaxID=285679 RepID=UPI0033C0C752